MNSGSLFATVIFASILSASVGAVVGAAVAGDRAPAETSGSLSPEQVENLLAAHAAELRAEIDNRRRPVSQGLSVADVQDLLRRAREEWRADAPLAPAQTADAPSEDDGTVAELRERLRAMDEHVAALQSRLDAREAREERTRERDVQRQEAAQRRMLEGMVQAAPAVVPGISRIATRRLSEQLSLDEHQRTRVQETLEANMMRAAEIIRENRVDGTKTDEQAQTELEQVMADTNRDMRSILTPDQFQQWEELTEGGMPGLPGLPGAPNRPQREGF